MPAERIDNVVGTGPCALAAIVRDRFIFLGLVEAAHSELERPLDREQPVHRTRFRLCEDVLDGLLDASDNLVRGNLQVVGPRSATRMERERARNVAVEDIRKLFDGCCASAGVVRSS